MRNGKGLWLVLVFIIAGTRVMSRSSFQVQTVVSAGECLRVTFKDGDCSWDAGSKTLACGIDPGETVENTFNVENTGGGDLTVNAVLSGLPASISYLVDPSNFALDAGDNQDVDIVLAAAGDCPPGKTKAMLICEARPEVFKVYLSLILVKKSQ